MTNVLIFTNQASRDVTTTAAPLEPSEQEYRVMSGALGRLRDQLFKLTAELELGCAQLTMMATANSLTSGIAEEARRNACSHSSFNP